MDIQFIQLEHRKDVISITEICGISIEEAYHLYHQHNCDIQPAINFKLGLISPINQRIQSPYNHEEHSSDEINVSYEDELDEHYQKYRHFVQKGKPFFEKYPLKIKATQISKQINPQQNISMQTSLQTKLISKIQLRIVAGGIEQGIYWSWKQNFPIGLLLINFEQQSIHELSPIIKNKDTVIQMNTFFRIYAININQQSLPKWSNVFVDSVKDANSLVVLRVNYIDQIEVVSKIKFGQPQEFVNKIKYAKSQSTQRQLDEKHIIKQHFLISKGKRYVRPNSIKQKIKLRQDARLRKQQDEQFHKMFKPIKEMEKINQQSQTCLRLSPFQLKKQRDSKRQKMRIYDLGISLKIRVPSGKSYMIKVDPSEHAQYLFDYVDSLSDDIGFQNDYSRNFDILYGDQKNQSLRLKSNHLINDVLEQFELLIVKEIS